MIGDDVPERVSIWLIPSDEHRSLLSRYIEELSERLHSVPFEPHITLFSGRISFHQVFRALDFAADRCPPFYLQVNGIKSEDLFTKTLYLSIKGTEDLLDLSKLLGSYFSASSFSFDPHLSLAYKNLPELTRKSLARETGVMMSSIKFSSLQAVHTPISAKTENDIRIWKPVYSIRLA
ncbi:MAG: 2'-5' RNA ligase family protein [Deltaproteobacteria bacterium]|nr:2'-5' RNA ligase family protein [Deltaproteobacteria bacterium]